MPYLLNLSFVNNHQTKKFVLKSKSLRSLEFVHWHQMDSIELDCPLLCKLMLDNCSKLADSATQQLAQQAVLELHAYSLLS